MRNDERASLQVIKDALKLQRLEGKKFVLRAWAHWGTSQATIIHKLDVTLAPTIEPEVILRRARTTIEAQIVELGFSAEDAARAYLELQAEESPRTPAG
ncbi:hypothetical protein [Phenylobacterium montanum]|uniref:Uncharacterized protein n=1 Tax=Phenylobacterium montanum TaxID=2823693 RepID=A0A975IV59_9CAUL|nr:hypothetical protein [Caulobacter sp. S6]QUD86971.1 hypothetical protein KCG34_18110 [Caulobacter sp. S6]